MQPEIKSASKCSVESEPEKCVLWWERTLLASFLCLTQQSLKQGRNYLQAQVWSLSPAFHWTYKPCTMRSVLHYSKVLHTLAISLGFLSSLPTALRKTRELQNPPFQLREYTKALFTVYRKDGEGGDPSLKTSACPQKMTLEYQHSMQLCNVCCLCVI